MPYELVNDNEQEGLLGTLGRGAARTLARGTEAVAGLPGDIVGGIAGLGNLASEKISGSKIPGFESLQSNPFTSQSIKENVTEKLTGDYLKPQGKGEELLDEIVGDLSTLLVPGGIASKGASLTGKAVARGAGKVAAGVAASQIAKGLGASDQTAGFAKLGTSLLSNTFNGRKALEKQIDFDYGVADKALGKTAEIKNPRLQKTILSDIEKVKKGVSPQRKDILKVLQGVERNFYNVKEKIGPDIAYEYPVDYVGKKITPPKAKISPGHINVRDMWNLKKNINEWMKDPELSSGTKQQLGKTLGDLNGELGKYAEHYPKFGIPYQRAEELFKATQKGSVLNKFLQENVTLGNALNKWKPLSLLGYTLYHANVAQPATLVGALGAGIGVREAVRMTEFLYNSPIARQHYKSLIRAAAAGDGATAAKDIRKIDELAAKAGLTAGGGGYQLVS